MNKSKTRRTKQEIKSVEQSLELTRRFILEIIRNPKKVKDIPSGATIILYPIKV